jgi:succinate--hydroxymethylglutarate CoA-transferase
MVDMCTGLYMHGAILAALEARHRTGKGQKLDASLFETQISMLVNVAATYLNTGQEAKRWGTGHPTIAPYSAFPTKDSYIVVGAVNDRQFASLMKHLGNPDLCGDPRFIDNASRVHHRAELKQILDRYFQRKTTKEWLAAFEGTGMPYGPINNVEGALSHPQVGPRHMIETMDMEATVAGKVRVVGSFTDIMARDVQQSADLISDRHSCQIRRHETFHPPNCAITWRAYRGSTAADWNFRTDHEGASR